MKDLSNKHNNRASASAYPWKRPTSSSSGVSKKPTPTRRSPRSAKAALIAQRQRDQQAQALRKEGVLLEEEYRDDIRRYMHDMELSTIPTLQCMDQQPEIKWHMRPSLVDFLVEVHFSFRLRPETLYLALNIIDRYVSKRVVYVKHYQLVGCAALWIAAKFEDAKERVPTIQDLTEMCHGAYSESAFCQMEGHILSTIQWTLGHPTAESWLRLMCCGVNQEESQVQHVARFLMEITLFYREFVVYSPSTIALASLTLARFLCGKPRRPWEESEECVDVVELLDTRLSKHINEVSETLLKKYSYAFYSKASTMVVRIYVNGGGFSRWSSAPFPITPTRHSPALSPATSPASTISDMSDDGPLTPSTPLDLTMPDGFGDVGDDKENLPVSFEPVYTTKQAPVEAQFIPHDLVALGRVPLFPRNAPGVS
ncbi:hypothetical protein CYLTODRAFT_421224 [Cylindrobasidium torrendii FP15055 ss-10]|uniref:Uncharacterized protein n=1 Tax=Cylindrobasidium torrendii FP15055 ss-10 TaxID=1314674 RepID=A0A0D7BEH1_9AGAR|nr:hypothetical protein CYLTODRAFT_421224 [Cylindrobasidium torrendii FP15055 ss-10]